MTEKNNNRMPMARKMSQAIAVLVVFSFVGAALAFIFTPFLDPAPAEADVAAVQPQKTDLAPQQLDIEHYLPPAPDEAPPALKETVLAGYRIALGQTVEPDGAIRTKQGELTCNSCHFKGGLTDGSRNNGFSLVGSASQFPRALPDGSLIDLAGRINRCRVLHMGQKPWESDSPPMQEMVTYLSWISQGVPQYAEVSWLEIKPLTEEDSQGKTVDAPELFTQECSMCHGKEGEGTPAAPPVWGDKSFLADSEMAQPGILARFIYQNMPQGTARPLTKEQAVAVTRFILEHPRPASPSGFNAMDSVPARNTFSGK